jgi:hypothetical protein
MESRRLAHMLDSLVRVSRRVDRGTVYSPQTYSFSPLLCTSQKETQNVSGGTRKGRPAAHHLVHTPGQRRGIDTPKRITPPLIRTSDARWFAAVATVCGAPQRLARLSLSPHALDKTFVVDASGSLVLSRSGNRAGPIVVLRASYHGYHG